MGRIDLGLALAQAMGIAMGIGNRQQATGNRQGMGDTQQLSNAKANYLKRVSPPALAEDQKKARHEVVVPIQR